jgi:RNA polymerase sigma factor (sigma-70 family)
MKYFKTNRKHRKRYRYYFADGTSKTIETNESVSSTDIKCLHQLDDDLVDAERREAYLVPVHYGNTSVFNLEKNPLLVDESSPLEQLILTEKIADKEKLIHSLHEAIKELEPKQRATLEKIFYEGKSPADIAREEGLSKPAITYRLKNIYKKLKIVLKG